MWPPNFPRQIQGRPPNFPQANQPLNLWTLVDSGASRIPLSKVEHMSGPETNLTLITGDCGRWVSLALAPVAKLHQACKALHTTTLLGVPSKFTTAKFATAKLD